MCLLTFCSFVTFRSMLAMITSYIDCSETVFPCSSNEIVIKLHLEHNECHTCYGFRHPAPCVGCVSGSPIKLQPFSANIF